jgi:branched-subunit amino acid aminotransferase/4-amino-4-deoxychorismate lyase
MLAILDGTVMPADEVRIPATDEGLLRGDGVFEVVRLYDGQPFALDDHLVRMERSAANLRLPFPADAVRADVAALLEAGRPGDGVLRVLLTRGGRRIGFIEPLPVLPPSLTLRTVTYSPTRILDGVKSLSYGANMLASRIAREHGDDEALLVTPHGRVLEAPTSSFFCSLDGRTLVTPPLDDHILDSITRRRLIAVCEVEQRPIAADELPGVREAFLTSTVREVLPVHAIDGREVQVVEGALTTEAAARVRAHIEQELGVAAG